MANTLRFKRGLVSGIPTAVAGEPLFTTDTFDLYIGNGTTNTRFQKYIASGTSSQYLKGDGSLDSTTYTPTTRSISTTSPLVGGGDLSADRTLSIPAATTSVNGYLTSTDWTTFNGKQNAITLTTTGTSGAATLVGATLNIPQYADQFVGTVTSVAALTLGTTGTDLSSSVANGTTTPVITLNVPTASATNRGALSSADWSTFNSKQGTITLTTTGTSGAATFSSNTLNIPQYQSVITNPVTGTGTTNYLPKWTSGTAIGNSLVYDDGDGVGIGLLSPQYKLQVLSSSTSISAFRNSGAAIGQIIVGNTVADLSLRVLADGNSFIFSDTSKQLAFGINNGIEQMRLTSTGLGIGTTSPSGASGLALAINGGANQTRIALKNNITGDASGDGFQIVLDSIGVDVGIENRENGHIRFTTSNTERLRITSGGNVGVGTTSPNFPLTIDKSASYTLGLLNSNIGTVGQYTGLTFGYTGTTYQKGAVYFISKDANGVGDLVFALNNVASSANVSTSDERMRITSGGNVGIGTTSPSSTLQVRGDNGSSVSAVLRIRDTNSTARTTRLQFEDYAGAYADGLIDFKIPTAGSAVGARLDIGVDSAIMSLVRGGSVGIGTTSPATKLHLVDSVESEIRTQYSTTSSGKLITGNGFTTIGSITNDPFVFVSNNTERMRLTNAGNLGVGNTSASAKLHVTGNILSYTEAANTASLFISANNSYNWQFGIGNSSNFVITENGGLNAIGTERLSITSGGAATFNSTIKTAAPTGYAAKPYKLGEVLNGAVTVPTKSVAVEIDGTVYFLLASTTLP